MQNTFSKKNLWLSLFFLIGLIPGNTQTTMTPDGEFHTLYYDPNDKVQELKIPDDITGGRIYLEGIGGDGGIKKNYREGSNLRAEGGEGALIGAWFEIGYASHQIPPGATILFIIGEKGQDEWAVTPSQAGGGGGTGILFQPNSSSGYNLLIVAGGGGGGAADCCLVQIHGKPGEIVQCVIDNGLPYNPYGSETYCYDGRTTYQDQYHCHRAGSVWDDNSDASYFAGNDSYTTPCECSGQAGWPGSQHHRDRNNPVKPTGAGMYGNCDGRPSGGFGFGSGAPGKKNLSTESSGGGGYTVSSSSGGGSFIADYFSMNQQDEKYLQRGTTRNPEHGNVRYKIIPAPKAVCNDLEVSLPATGTQGLAYFVMAYGSTTTIPLENLLVAEVQSQELITILDCADIGTQAITMEVIGTISGLRTPCTANLTVKDEKPPVISCKDISISTDAYGHASFSIAALLDSYTDNCSSSPALLTADNNSFSYDCSFDGQTITESVKVIATDDHGNSKNCTATVSIAVTAVDKLPPIASCKAIAVQLGSQGALTITPSAIDQGSTDLCGNIASYQFGQSHLGLQVETEGFNADLSWTITSLDGNTVFAERTNYPHDAPSPGLGASETSFHEEILLAAGCYLFNWKDSYGDGFWCYGETNFYRLTDVDGNVLAYGECDDIGYGQSTQICIEADTFLDEWVLDCDDIGDQAVALVLTDANGNTSSCQSVVTVEGGPQAICKPVTVQLSTEGAASLLAASLDAGSWSNCGNITSYQLGQSNLQLQVESEGFNTDLSWTITSLDGNTVYAERTSYPHDAPSPGIGASETSFLEDINLAPGCYLFNWKDSYGDGFWCYGETNFYQLTNSDGDVLAYGECASIGFGQSTEFCVSPDTFVDELTFDCDDVGDRLATLFVKDATGRSSSCQVTIEVEGPPAQAVQCAPDPVVIHLDEDGLANLSVEQVLYGEVSPCYENQYSLSKTEFDCQVMGTHQLTLTAYHPDGSSSSCEAIVKVRDDILPIPICKDITASLDQDGQVTLDASLADGGSTDGCGIYDLYFGDYTQIKTFDCEDVGVESYYTMIVEDYSGNLAYCDITLTIKDEIPPQVSCKDITIQLDDDGIAIIPEDAINDLSSDLCGSLSFDTDITSFNCEDLGDHTLTLTAQDVHGNSNSCEANVKVEDPIAPIALCQDITIDLDLDGIAIINPISLDGGSTDNCGIETIAVTTSSLDRTHIGDNSLELLVVDASGNANSCTAIVTVNPVLIAYSWDDQNGDGKQDVNEPPLADIPVAIIDHSSDTLIQEGVTNADGEAIFSVPDIAPSQKIKLLFTERVDHRFTLKDWGNNDLIDSDVNRSNGLTKTFTLDAGGSTEQWDAGLWSPGEIQAFVWEDLDGDGKQDDGEPALVDAQVELLEKNNSIILTTTTDENGIATIFDVPANRSVKLRFIALEGYSLTKKDKGNDDIDSDAKPSNGLTATFSSDKGQQLFTQWDAGMINNNQNALTDNQEIQSLAFYEVENNELKLKVITNHLTVYPNPFSNLTTIEFSLSELEQVALKVFNQQGQLVNKLIDSQLEPGKHRRLWDGSAFGGTKLPAGIYFIRLRVGKKWITEKVSLVRD